MLAWGPPHPVSVISITLVLVGVCTLVITPNDTFSTTAARTLGGHIGSSISNKSRDLLNRLPRVSRLLRDVGMPEKRSTSSLPADDVNALQKRIACMFDGIWVKNESLRMLPWSQERLSASCDQFAVYNKSGVAFKEADRVAEGGCAKDWLVRSPLKWEWRVPPECPYESFNRNRMCKLLDVVGNALFVGDSMQG